MATHGAARAGTATPHSQRLTPNEKAILDRIGSPSLREIATSIWRLKLRLQFTGWLQYIPPAIAALAVFLLAALSFLLRILPLGYGLIGLGSALWSIWVFDLVTVKFRVRFPEPLPKRLDGLDTFDLLRARRSCRSFQTRKLTASDLSELLASVRFHSQEPTIGQAPVRFEYVSAPLTVWPTVNASEFLVAIAPKTYDRLAVIDVGRSLQKIVVDATRMGLGTCWIGPGADQSSVAYHLGDRFDPELDHIICVCAVGYKSWYTPLFIRVFNFQFRRRLPLSSLFFADPDLRVPLDVDAEPFSRYGRTYEVCQWSPSSYNGQTTRCVAVVDGRSENPDNKNRHATRILRFDFYATTESRYYAPVAVGIWCADWEEGCSALDLHGKFAVLSTRERGLADLPAPATPPRYDVSWLADENQPQP